MKAALAGGLLPRHQIERRSNLPYWAGAVLRGPAGGVMSEMGQNAKYKKSPCFPLYSNSGHVAASRRTILIRQHQLPLLRIARSRLRDQLLQLRNARAAIGARFQLGADVRRRPRAARDGIADGVAADTEAGANDRAGIGKAIDRFA